MSQSNPLSFGERAKASVPVGDQDQEAYLRKTYGDENVFQDSRDGRFWIRRAPNEAPTPVDPSGFEAGDIADFAGIAMEAVPGTLAGLAIMNPFAVGAADAVGSGIRSFVGSQMSGNEVDMGPTVGRAAIAGLLGGTAQKAANILGGMPLRNIPNRYARSAASTPEARQSQQLLQEAGLPPKTLTLGEQGGNRSILMMEQLARQAPGAADIVHPYDVARIGDVSRRLGSMRDAYSSLGPEATGAKAQSAFRQYKDALFDQRSRQWNETMKGISDGAPIPTSNFKKELQAIIEESDVIGGNPALKELNRKLANTGDVETATRIRNTLSEYAKAAAGKARIFSSLDDRTKERAIAGRLLRALGDDLDEVAQAGHPAAGAITEARQGWKTASEEIANLEETQLSRLLGTGNPSPEQAAERIINMKRPGEIRNTMDLLESMSGEAASGVRANVLQTYLDKAVPGASSGDLPLSPAKFVTAIRKDRGRLQAMLGKDGYSELRRIGEVLGKIADRAGLGGSQTGPLMMLFEMAKTAGGDLTAAGGSAAGLLTTKRIARAMATPEGRKALLTLNQRGPISRQTFQGLSGLVGAWQMDEQLNQPVEEMPISP